MPFIKLEAAKVTPEQKENLIADLTKVASKHLGVPEEFFYVLIKENEPENWGVAGKTLPKFLADKSKK